MGDSNPPPDPVGFHERASPVKLEGPTLWFQQFTAVAEKNVLLLWRNLSTTLARLVAPIFFTLLVYLIDEALQASQQGNTTFQSITRPKAETVTGIRPCEEALLYLEEGKACLDFLYAPSGDATTEALVTLIRENNSPAISASRVKGFANANAIDEYLLANPETVAGAYIFNPVSSTEIRYTIQTNQTIKFVRGKFEDPNFAQLAPMQVQAEQAIMRHVSGKAVTVNVQVKEFPHPPARLFSNVAAIGQLFFFASSLFGFVPQMEQLVSEREKRLREAMRCMGLRDSAFWTSYFSVELVVVTLTALILVLSGMAFGFSFFTVNDFGVVFLVFWMFGLCMTAFGAFLSIFIDKASSVTSLGFVIFILGFITLIVTTFGFPYSDNEEYGKPWIQNLWSLFPPNLLGKAMADLGAMSATDQSEGIRIADIGGEYCPKRAAFACDYFPVGECLLTMFWVGILYLALALYCENVVPDMHGYRRGYFYFADPAYWGFAEAIFVPDEKTQADEAKADQSKDDEDVLKEEARLQDVYSRALTTMDAKEPIIMVAGMWKTYRSGDPKAIERRCGTCCNNWCCCCLPCAQLLSTEDEVIAFNAVRGNWWGVEEGELFCLLGPNGAGKTTSIHVLTGVIPASSGDCRVLGNSVVTEGGMDKVRPNMGFCPQFDLLWNELTALEHLRLFARIKGLQPADVEAEAQRRLDQVNLREAEFRLAGMFSGGMRRRLSCAVAFIGDPKVVYLDEPTTGMDPISRREVWNIIEEAKAGRSIVLTTHSMEEADILGDKISIMAKGRVRCVGSSLRLKQRFGAGYKISLAMSGVRERFASKTDLVSMGEEGRDLVSDDEEARRKAAINDMMKESLDAVLAEETGSYLHYTVKGSEAARLEAFFRRMDDEMVDFHISDIQISLTTLEEVFLTIARKAELEAAIEEGNNTSITLPGDGQQAETTLEVPTGADEVPLPDGSTIALKWGVDADGSLTLEKATKILSDGSTIDIDVL